MKKSILFGIVFVLALFVFVACDGTIADTGDSNSNAANEGSVGNSAENTGGDQVAQKQTASVEISSCRQNKDCDDGIACTWDVCNLCTGVCSHELEDSYCADQPGHECQVGICSPDSIDTTDESGCVWTQLNEGAVCNDGNNCTVQDTCTADGQCVGEIAEIGGIEFCALCQSDNDCVESVKCVVDHIWGIQYLGACQPDGTCAVRVVSQNDSDPEVAAVWTANCQP